MTEQASQRLPSDAVRVEAQLGRKAREPWHVAARCEYGWPTVIETLPALHDGSPFPTLYWLTCPWLVGRVSAEESSGRVAREAARLADEPERAEAMHAADCEYRARRAAAGSGRDPLASTGIAGQRDPLATKCLHAHVAAALAGIEDPIGGDILAEVGSVCEDGRCAHLGRLDVSGDAR